MSMVDKESQDIVVQRQRLTLNTSREPHSASWFGAFRIFNNAARTRQHNAFVRRDRLCEIWTAHSNFCHSFKLIRRTQNCQNTTQVSISYRRYPSQVTYHLSSPLGINLVSPTSCPSRQSPTVSCRSRLHTASALHRPSPPSLYALFPQYALPAPTPSPTLPQPEILWNSSSLHRYPRVLEALEM